MRKLDGNFAVGCGPGTDYPSIHVSTDAITNEVLESITFVLAYPTVCVRVCTACNDAGLQPLACWGLRVLIPPGAWMSASLCMVYVVR